MAKASLDDALDSLAEAERSRDTTQIAVAAASVLEIDENNTEAKYAVFSNGMPVMNRRGQYRTDPTMLQAAKGFRRLKEIVELDPTHRGAWYRGALLLSQHLGMTAEVLEWWEDYRTHFPDDTVPLIEEAGLLLRMGMYEEVAERLVCIYDEGMEDVPRHLRSRVESMDGTVTKYFEMEEKNVFRPEDPKSPAWKDIESMRNSKPSSETFTFFMLAGPLVLWEGLLIPEFIGRGWIQMIVTILVVYISIMFVKKWSIKLTDKRNRPVLDLWRAIEVEATSGNTCIPKSMRDSKLYNRVMSRNYPVAFRERHERIVDADEIISPRWKMKLPEWHDYSEEE
jgi:hypothetical protein